MSRGRVIFVLHAHLPFVRHQDRDDRLEEIWLFEALSETYIPLLQALERLRRRGAQVKLTVSLSPPLITMLADPLLQSRYRQHLVRSLASAAREQERTRGDLRFHALSTVYAERLQALSQWYEDHHGDIVGEFRRLAGLGFLSLWTSAATHAFLPLLTSESAVECQVETGVRTFGRLMGAKPQGFWLPECGYRPGLERVLGQHRLGYTVIRADADQLGPAGIYRPVRLGAGVAGLVRAESLSMRVWDAHGGYPGSPAYRDFYRDIGFDLNEETVAPYLYPAGVRRATGFKYWRVTGADVDKEPYELAPAALAVEQDAKDFIRRVDQELQAGEGSGTADPVVTLPFDAELFGHWWYEGVDWLEAVLPRLPLMLAEELEPSQLSRPARPLAFSSWGRGGFGEVWLNPTNDWIYPQLARADQTMVDLAQHRDRASIDNGLGNQALRELLLAQSSDWPFMMDADNARDYATERIQTHLGRFAELVAMACGEAAVDPERVRQIAEEDLIFPNIDWRQYHPYLAGAGSLRHASIMMLSWEYPPYVVGGLGQHVYDLSRYLVGRGSRVTVVTVARDGTAPKREWMDGVEVVRVAVPAPSGENFWDWVISMNLAIYQAARALALPDVLHAHDWLVADAAIALQDQAHRPLVATIHATERGRQGGIYTPLQRQIDAQERRLSRSANRVIVCSRAMRREIVQQWNIPAPKISILPNGVDPARVRAGKGMPRGYREDRRWLLFFGRLVPEKGIDVLLEALPAILREVPDVALAVLGSGPYRRDLEARAEELGVTDAVHFLGFARQRQRNLWLAHVAVAIFPSRYEPFGIAALEAMVAGVPVIASKVGGMADFVRDGVNALAVNADDVDGLADATLALLHDTDRAQRLATQAEHDARHFGWDQIARRTDHAYARALRTGRL